MWTSVISHGSILYSFCISMVYSSIFAYQYDKKVFFFFLQYPSMKNAYAVHKYCPINKQQQCLIHHPTWDNPKTDPRFWGWSSSLCKINSNSFDQVQCAHFHGVGLGVPGSSRNTSRRWEPWSVTSRQKRRRMLSCWRKQGKERTPLLTMPHNSL